MGNKLPSLRQFQDRFVSEDACLDHLMVTRYGLRHSCAKCGRVAKFHRVKSRRCYECDFCGAQVYPTAGTPFEATRTSLRDWFTVMFMFTTSRNGVSAKEVQRTIGVTYKTAWRMCNLIRQYMGYVDGDNTLGGKDGGIVEADEMFFGGVDKRGEDDKAIIFGAIERGGDVVTQVIPSRKARHIMPAILKWVKPGSRVATDELPSYGELMENGYMHGTVNHSAGEYVSGQVHTNNIEAFWSHFRRSMNGTYVSVSKKWLQTYLWEFEYRQNLRQEPHLMIDLLLKSFPRPVGK
ncbi:IS1595 family transposase [Mesorhizobium sp.]|uniref:IS1595 family transposase n=1 Tax=Mesorhizobium sp. TaxID=1871066 RepID=UPI000FE6D4EB|nr:IS1595 family transposase [Mesorhizobium sp.]RWC27773.1 MAG: IS1595 family transposase [Mesorhizobium sp.]TIX25324.1 MAG: IS1595 family transposase [Mesorhizobium sp.]